MNKLKKILLKAKILIFGKYSKEGFYQKNSKVLADKYEFSSVFPNEATMKQVINIISIKPTNRKDNDKNENRYY